MGELRLRAADHSRAHEVLEVAHVKEWTGASRKFVVPILEWFDAHHVTVFDGRQRTRGSDCP